MAKQLKTVIEKAEYEGLPEPLKEFYEEKNGKYNLSSDYEDVTGLKNTVAALRKERSEAEAELNRYKEIGDVDKAKAALTKVQDLEEQEAKKSGEWEKLKTQMIERHAQEKTDLKGQLTGMEKDLEGLVVDREIVTVLTDPEVSGSVKTLLPHMKNRVKAVKEGGQWRPIVHNGDGTPSVADGSGTPMTIKQLALEMKKDPDFAPNFRSVSTSGSGTPPNAAATGGRGSGKTVKKGDTEALKQNFADIASGKVAVED